MTTKPPSPVKPAAGESLESIAYACVASIPTVEPHEQDRLGYSLWLWLKHRRDPLEVALKASRVRLKIGEEEALARIQESLKGHGILP
jgi:hypothetical protein